jgi:hypothetical protein
MLDQWVSQRFSLIDWGIRPYQRLLDRAARARGIAMMPSKADAKAVEAYAAECEAKAILLIGEQRVRIAA